MAPYFFNFGMVPFFFHRLSQHQNLACDSRYFFGHRDMVVLSIRALIVLISQSGFPDDVIAFRTICYDVMLSLGRSRAETNWSCLQRTRYIYIYILCIYLLCIYKYYIYLNLVK